MIFLLDNYDSFTYNLYDYLARLGADIVVERNNRINCAQIQKLSPQAIVISPGPKTPREAGILMEVIDIFHRTTPILGICLGYQGLGEYFGASLEHAKIPMHGKTSNIFFDEQDPVFKNLDQNMSVMRYHSLNIANIPDELTITAKTEDGENMALKHKHFPIYGLQFHPESILTSGGFTILSNWHAAYVSAVPIT